METKGRGRTWLWETTPHESVPADRAFGKRVRSKGEQENDEGCHAYGLDPLANKDEINRAWLWATGLAPARDVVKCCHFLTYLKNIPFYGQEERL